jgi:hypothetical protein
MQLPEGEGRGRGSQANGGNRLALKPSDYSVSELSAVVTTPAYDLAILDDGARMILPSGNRRGDVARGCVSGFCVIGHRVIRCIEGVVGQGGQVLEA